MRPGTQARQCSAVVAFPELREDHAKQAASVVSAGLPIMAGASQYKRTPQVEAGLSTAVAQVMNG
jgi:hypothetical protein